MTDQNPTVTFIVPCYKLAHLLGECIQSILAQSYGDFEVLVMDDCSPDNTPEVAASFNDPRVKHIRNEPNLGHLRNYNKGIEAARGRYIWLISADDCLRSQFALERYLELLESRPKVGYIFSPAVRLENGVEGELLAYSVHAKRDTVFEGRQFLKKLIHANTIVAPSVLVRSECYHEISVFPLDMPWAGDWYLWCVFALSYDVAYIAEPLVYYRRHTGSMTNLLTTQEIGKCLDEDVAMPWVIKGKAEAAGYHDLKKPCLLAAANEYAKSVLSRTYKTATASAAASLSLDAFEQSLASHAANREEQHLVQARVYARVGTKHLWENNRQLARSYLWKSLVLDPWMLKTWAKLLLASSGGWSVRCSKHLLGLRTRLWAA